MQILSFLTVLALTRLSIALPPLLLPSNTSSLPPHAINATVLSREPWPKAPWSYNLPPSSIIAIEYYGRSVCSEDDFCEARATDAIHELLRITRQKYISERGREDSFTWDVATFSIRQETKVLEFIIDMLIRVMILLTEAHGTTEVADARLTIHGELIATFALTFPGVED